MYIKSLTLKNFRNYTDETFEFTNGLNLLVGANAQGKTNVAEAVFLLCTGYSPKTAKHKIFIRCGQDYAELFAEGYSEYGKITLSSCFNQNGDREIKVNGAKISKMADIFGNINSVFFNPAELKLVQESPEDRRRFMNIPLSQLSKKYFTALIRYNKILEQRNNLLKNPDKSIVLDTLPVWDLQLAGEASKIYYERNAFIEKIAPIAKKACENLSNGKETLLVELESTIKGDLDEIKNACYDNLIRNTEKDLKLGYTTFGPHRQDIKLTLNGTDVKNYGSQGQQRTTALALKLAEAEIFKIETGEYPVLILDDVFSELDRERQKLLVKYITGMQAIITATHVERGALTGLEVNKITIADGKIKRLRTKKSTNGMMKLDQKGK